MNILKTEFPRISTPSWFLIPIEMPFSKDAGAIARVLEHRRPGRLGAVEDLGVGGHAVPGREAAGQKGGAARSADP